MTKSRERVVCAYTPRVQIGKLCHYDMRECILEVSKGGFGASGNRKGREGRVKDCDVGRA